MQHTVYNSRLNNFDMSLHFLKLQWVCSRQHCKGSVGRVQITAARMGSEQKCSQVLQTQFAKDHGWTPGVNSGDMVSRGKGLCAQSQVLIANLAVNLRKMPTPVLKQIQKLKAKARFGKKSSKQRLKTSHADEAASFLHLW